MPPLTMYGMKVSGHTARTRSYFIKAGIPFCERSPSIQHYLTHIVPLAGGKSTMPITLPVRARWSCRPAGQLTPTYSPSVDICFHRYRRAISAGR